jgi:large subunit ribosomal protein L6
MSRIGKKIITLPAGVVLTVDTSTHTVHAKGPLGELSQVYLPFVKVAIEGDTVTFEIENEKEKFQRAMWGTTRALVSNIIEGVSTGFEKEIELNGVGYRMELSGNNLRLFIGFSHHVDVAVPPEVKLTLDKNLLKGKSIEKQKVGYFFASLFARKPHEPYKGKGFKFPGINYQRKEGKKLAK